MSIGNKPIGDPNVGPRSDFVGVPFTPGINTLMAYAVTGYYHVHGQAFVYPNLADNVTLTSGVAAWEPGTITEVIPAGALSSNAFDLHWLNIAELSGNSDYQVDIYSGDPGSEVWLSAARANRNSVFTTEGPQRIQVPQQVAGTRISCRLSNSSGSSETCTVSFSGHYYGVVA